MVDLKDAGLPTIIGVGETAIGRLGRSGDSLRLEAARAAILDAGLRASDVDGIVVRQPRGNPVPNYSVWLAQRLGIGSAYVNDISLGGAAAATTILTAVGAIATGLATTVLCVAGENQWSGRTDSGPGKLGVPGGDYTVPFGAHLATVAYGFGARRYMDRHAVTSAQLGRVAVAARQYASRNDNAQARDLITLEDHQASRIVADPLRALDCCQISDAAGAVIVTTAARAEALGVPGVQVAGMGSAASFGQFAYGSEEARPAAVAFGKATKMAGVEGTELDFAELYDPFTSVVLTTLEDYGLVPEGEAGAFVEEGGIDFGGPLAINTHGGLLAQGHAAGMFHITEAVSQLRGTAGERQVQNARMGAVSGECGETGIHVSLVLSRR